MSTKVRSKLQKSNKYWISQHRYYELKHFCLQYPGWKKMLHYIDGYSRNRIDISNLGKKSLPSKPTESAFEEREFYYDRIDMLDQVALETDEELGSYILKGITEGISYDIVKARLEIPCSKDVYYDLYRRFVWLLDKARG